MKARCLANLVLILTLCVSVTAVSQEAVEVAPISIQDPSEEEINISVRLRAYEEGWNQGNIDIVDEIYSDDFVGSMPPFNTKEGVKMGLLAYRAAIPDIHAEVEDAIAQGDMVATRYTMSGTQQGELMGIPPTGLYATTTGISIARMADGKIIQVWENNDILGMMEQLGVAPATRDTYTWGEPSPIVGEPGTPDGNMAISREAIEQVWGQGNTNVVDDLYHVEHLRHDPSSPGIDSAEAFKVMIAGFHAAFSDVDFVLQEQFAQGDKVVNISQLTGTHAAEYGGIPPTGNVISTMIISIHRIADGMIAESWVARDTLGIIEQLTAEPEPEPDLEGFILDHITSPSLEGNPLGDPAEREMVVYLPPSYETSDKRYPVIYLLHGYTDTARQYISRHDPVWAAIEAMGLGEPPDFPEEGLGPMFDNMIAAGKMSEMIIVTPDADSAYGGSLYNNSELNGNYEDYIVKDLVDYIDSKYRTIPDRNSRAIAGQSAGGYGAVKLAMRYPDVFGAVASFCGVLSIDFFQAAIPAVIAENPEGMMGPSPEKAYTSIFYAMSAASSPNLDNPPFYVDLPFEYPSGNIIDEIWSKHLENNPVTMLATHADNTASLNGIYLDAGNVDEYGANFQTTAYHEALVAAGIEHEFEIFAGGHRNRLFERMRMAMSYLSGVLAAEAPEEDDNVFFMSLNQGLNMVSLPLMPTTPYTADTFAEYLSATVVIRYDSELRKFIGHKAGTLYNNYLIEGGKGYIVNTPDAGTVAFTGGAWANDPPVEMAPPVAHSSDTWAFMVNGSIGANNGSHYATVKNLRTGDTNIEAVHADGYFVSAWADLTRNPVVEVGDAIEITVRDSSDSIVSGPSIHNVTIDSIRNAVIDVRMRMGNIIPAKSVLLQNYPNPFNPETWIPYHLNKSSEVSIKIYDASGKLVRAIDLGNKNAGIYTSRADAAYWDGKNEAGEEVASGLYFYSLETKKFSDIRKMTIKK